MNSDIVKALLGNLLRQALLALGAWLTAHGLTDTAGVDAILGGGLALGSVVWSLWVKYGEAKVLSILKKGVTVGLIAFLILAAPGGGGIGNAYAATKKPVLTGNLVADVSNALSGTSGTDPFSKLWSNIQGASLTDLQYAKALADNAATSGSKARSACWAAWITLIQSQQGANATLNGKALGPEPTASLFTKFEQTSQVVDALQTNSPFMVACAPVAEATKLNITSFVASVAGGALGLATVAPAAGLAAPVLGAGLLP